MLENKMKTFLLFFSFSISISFAQNDSLKKTTVDEPIYGYVPDTMPEPIGGLDAIQRELLYPTEALINQVEGKVYLSALIDTLGNPKDIKIVKSIGYGCDEAAIYAVRLSKFKPATRMNNKIDCIVIIPIKFILPRKNRSTKNLVFIIPPS